ncbi:MAG: crossover junction endodeoxyribonuclease RuvC, partial [Patescibacteria group bacterium]|nr:crossover junction endodeoxyribonuclease RuvC [Patescibacteria group bacterium]
MRIIGIDPGYDRLGIAITEKTAHGKEKVVFSECFTTSPKESIYIRLNKIGSEIGRVIDEFEPEAMAIESLFLAKNQKTAMRVSEARGIMIYEAVNRGLEIHEFSPVEIKMAVTGDGTSDKSRIMKMVGLLIDLPHKEKALDDEMDAIAI